MTLSPFSFSMFLKYKRILSTKRIIYIHMTLIQIMYWYVLMQKSVSGIYYVKLKCVLYSKVSET
jgi:hypothetical protein